MKVYLSEPRHYLYDELQERPPEGVQYVRRSFSPRALLRASPRQAAAYLRNKALSDINTHVVLSESDFDLIHSNGSVIPAPQAPWIVDFESGMSLNFFQRMSDSERRRILSYLGQKECKEVLAHSEAAREGFIHHFRPDESVRNKLDVLYPAIRVPELSSNKSDTVTLCFAAKNFAMKGGEELVTAFSRLREEYGEEVRLEIASEGGERYADHEGVTHHGLLSRSEVYEMMDRADIFVYPSLRDTFGLVVLEAMAHALPVITFKEYAMPEVVGGGAGIICDGYSQKWFDEDNYARNFDFNDHEKLMDTLRSSGEREEVIKQLMAAIQDLIEHPEKRRSMSQEARRRVEEGKFSIGHRNQKLQEIYAEALD